MAFDLSTARPVKKQGFDIGTARLADPMVPSTPAESRPRAEVAAEGFQRQLAAAQPTLNPLEEGAAYVLDYARGVKNAFTRPQTTPDAIPTTSQLDAPLAAADAALSMGTGLVSPITGGIVRKFQHAMGNEDYTLRQGQEAATFQPRTQGGQAMLGAAGAVFKPLVDTAALAGRGYGEIAKLAGADPSTQSDVGTVAEDALLFGPMVKPAIGLAGRVSGALESARGAPVVNAKPFGDAVSRARQMGFKMTADYVATEAQRAAPIGETVRAPNRVRESFAGSEMDHAVTVDNSKIANQWAAREIGLSDSEALTPEALARAAYEPNSVFNRVAAEVPLTSLDADFGAAVEQLGSAQRNNPLLETSLPVERLRARMDDAGGQSIDTQHALDAVRQWRRDARVLFQSADDPAKLELAGAYRQAANALEGAIERTASSTGNGPLIAQLRAARTQLAKIHNVEDAMVGTDIDLRILAKIGQKVPLTGILGELANIGTHFPTIARPSTGLARPTPSGSGMIATLKYGGRRIAGEGLIPNMLTEGYQGKYGEFDPNYRPSSGPDFQPATEPPIMGPPEPAPGARYPGGRFPSAPAGEGPLALADELTGDVPFTETQLPTVAPEGLNLAESLMPDFGARGAPETGLTLPGPLDEALGSNPGIGRYGAEPFAPTQNGAPGLQPGRSVGMSDPLMPEPGPFGPDPGAPPRGPNDPSGFNPTGHPRAGGRGPTADSLRVAPDNAHELPGGLGDILGGEAPPNPVTGLPPALQAIADLVAGIDNGGGGNPLQSLVDAFGLGDRPAGPMAPPKGSAGLRGIKDELAMQDQPQGAAGPMDFPEGDLASSLDLFGEPPPEAPATVPAKPKRPAPAAPAEAPLGETVAAEGGLSGVLQRFREAQGVDEGQYQQRVAAALGDTSNPLNAAVAKLEQTAKEAPLGDTMALEDAPPRPAPAELSVDPVGPPLPKSKGKTASGMDIHENVEPNTLPGLTTRKGDIVLKGEHGRYVILEPKGKDRMVMRWTVVKESMQQKGFGSNQAVDAVRYANERGRMLDSDESITANQIKTWKRLFREGRVRAGREPDWAAIDAAAAKGGGLAKNTPGESWIKGIRLGPTE